MRMGKFSLRGSLGQVFGLTVLLLIALMVASTVSMVWPQGVVEVVPKKLEVLRILPTKIDVPTMERTIFSLINQERQRVGLAPLAWDDGLAQYAKEHSADMVRKGSLYHDKAELARLQAGENALLISSFGGGFILLPYPIGLAIYKTASDLFQESVDAWMKSLGHRSNILKADYKYTGVGVAVAEDGITYYITQNFR